MNVPDHADIQIICTMKFETSMCEIDLFSFFSHLFALLKLTFFIFSICQAKKEKNDTVNLYHNLANYKCRIIE